MLSTDKTRFTAPRVERSAGAVTVFNGGVYTACEPCKDHPERPPFWQIRAARIIENQQTHIVYYEDAWLEVGGVPIAYVPYFSAADPTVTRASGVLAPTLYQGNRLGYGVGLPYFYNLAPNYDLTLTPTYLSAQGVLGDVIWRHRLDNGEYDIRVTGIDQQDPGRFLAAPYGSGDQRWRGSLESEGKFYINDKWTYGWDVTAVSDRDYLSDYKIKDADISRYYFQDIVSSVYLRGQADRGFFDLSGYHFEGTTASTDQRTEPPVVPVLDYNRTFAIAPDMQRGNRRRSEDRPQRDEHQPRTRRCTSPAARNRSVKRSIMRIPSTTSARSPARASRQAASQPAASQLRRPTRPAIACCAASPAITRASPSRFPGNANSSIRSGKSGRRSCSRASTAKRPIWPPAGTSLTPARPDRAPSTTAARATSSTARPAAPPPAPCRASDWSIAIPSSRPRCSDEQIIEPIAQLIVRPNEIVPKLQPNEDAQSLVFDETNLFAWDKYSGYDRIEGGTRLNYGMQYTANFANSGHANFVGGESIQLAGQNSYTIGDAANTGLESGLDQKYSNFVAGETIAPFSSNFSITSKQQFDSSTFALARLDVIANAAFGGFTTSVDYGRYAAQPLLGWLYKREGLLTNASYKLDSAWTVDGSVLFDMSRHYYDLAGQATPVFFAPSYSFGLAYGDTCTTVKVRYSSTMSDPIPTVPAVRDQTLLLQLTLRTLGDIQASVGLQ